MKILWKGVAALGISVAALGAMAAPAQAQYYRDGYREWRGDRNWDRRWDNRRHWRNDRGYWRDGRNYRYRQRCWTEWRYDYYRDRDVRVRICR